MLHSVFPGVFLIDLPWTNVWLLANGRDAAVIDTGTRWDRGAVLAALRQALPSDFRLQSVLLTHGHCDHAGNAAFLAERFTARLHAHADEAPFLATRRTYVPRGVRAISPSGLMFAAGEAAFPVTRRAVDVVLNEGDCVETPIGPLRVLHTPGHTPGHVSYLHEDEGWLFSGDALLNVIPFVCRTGLSLPPAIFCSNMSRVRESARRIADVGPSALLAGHGWPHKERTADSIRAFVRRLPA